MVVSQDDSRVRGMSRRWIHDGWFHGRRSFVGYGFHDFIPLTACQREAVVPVLIV